MTPPLKSVTFIRKYPNMHVDTKWAQTNPIKIFVECGEKLLILSPL
jgi:hypothetical protein